MKKVKLFIRLFALYSVEKQKISTDERKNNLYSLENK